MWTHVHSILIFKGIDVERKNMHMQNKALLVSRPPQEHSLGHRTTAKRERSHMLTHGVDWILSVVPVISGASNAMGCQTPRGMKVQRNEPCIAPQQPEPLA